MGPSLERRALGGRADELELLAACLERSAGGRFQAVIVEGEAGIGKTWLLDVALDQARARGFRVFAGRSDEVERARPFGPIATALGCTPSADEPLRAGVARLLTGDLGQTRGPIEPTRDPGVQFRVVDALGDIVEESALAGPVALVLEDFQWADPSTLVAVRSLSRRLEYLPIALLATMRPLPRTAELELLLDALLRDGARQFQLGPLDERAVVELVAGLVGAEPATGLLKEVAGAAGNPLFVTELVKALEDEGAIHLTDGRAELQEVSLPPSLRLTILRRLSFLEEEALELLRTASLLGSTFSLRDVATVLARPATELVRPVRIALRAGVLEERDPELGFRHDLIREAIYEDLPGDVRAALHLEAGRRLAAARGPALQVAEQLALGAKPGDADAVGWLHEAARETARGAPEVAVGLLERALQIAVAADEQRPRLLADLLPPLLWSGRPQEAESRARDALVAPTPPDVEGVLRLGLVSALAAQGRSEDVIEEVRVAMSRPAVSDDVRSRLQAEAANALSFVDDLDAAESVAREAVATGTPVRSEGAAMGLLVLCEVSRVRGRPNEALELAEEAFAHAAGRLHWPQEIFRAMTLHQLDRFEEAHEVLREGLRADERLGNVSHLPVYYYEAASLYFRAGRWDDAVAQAQTGLDLADEVGLEMLLPWPHGILALIAVHRDDLVAASTSLAALEGHPGAETAALANALLQEARGERAGALATLVRAWDHDAAHGIVYRRRSLGPELVRLALAADDHDRAEEVAAGVEEAAALASVPSLAGAALRCRGLAEGDVDLLVRSVEAYRPALHAFERAASCEGAAAALAGAGRVPDATALFEEALGVYDQVGARRDQARALASMRGLGIGRKRRGARKRPLTGWESLTPSELDVVRLAAEGLTNPQIGQRLFISPRTVQTHLGHAFRKLDISSRVELAAESVRRGGV
jgi:DNA-binding CsgD family transcriptional regulator/tetratricopeptide (TPR) repeat protein